MARRITNEDLVLNLILNADQVDKGNSKLLQELHKMDRATRDLQIRYDQLRLKEKELIQQQGKNAAGLKGIRTEMKALKKEIEANHLKMNEWRKQIGVAGLTINQLRSRLAMLRIQLHNATDPTVLKTLRKQITETTLRIERMTTGMSRAAQAWRRMGTVANQFGTLTAWITIVLFGAARAISSTTKNLRELDKQYSSVMKTTDLTRGEVAKLKREFDQLNQDEGTRTPTRTKELLEIARIAGRLGIRGVEDIRDFTLAVDKLYVALGDDLEGSVEEITEQVGKLVNVFQLAGKEGLTQSEALLRVGSVLNELGKSSEANAQRILNFTGRMGGVGSMAKFTIDQIAGIGATLDATGVAVERGSTAVIKIINGLGENVEKFSRILGITVEDYKKWAEEDINGLLIAMLEATSKGNASILDVTANMGDMEITGVRVAEVFGKLTQNIDMVREQQLIAARAFESSASVMNEYYIITKDWDSLMALQGKRIKALADDYSKSMTPALYKVYRGAIDFAYAMRDGIVWIGEHIHIVKGLVLVYTALRATKIAGWIKEAWFGIGRLTSALWKNAGAAWANNAAIKAMKLDYAAAGGGVKGLTASLKALWGVMTTNPLTAIIALAGAAAGAFFLFKQRADEVKTAIGDMNVEMSTQSRHMKGLFEAAKKTAEGTAERANAIKTINEVYGEYLDGVLTEKDSIDKLSESYETANAKLREQIALKFKNDRYDKLMRDAAEERTKKQERMLGGIRNRDGAFAFGQAMFETDQVLERLAKITDPTARSLTISNFLEKWNIENQASRKAFLELIELRKEEIKLEKELDESIKGYLSGGTTGTSAGGGGPETPGTLLDEKTFETEKKKAEFDRDQQKLALMQMGLDRETYRKRELKLEENFLRQMVELTKQRFTTPGGDVIGGSREMLDAQLALQDNLNAQMDDGTVKTRKSSEERVDILKEELDRFEVMALAALEQRQITQEQFDLVMLQQQEQYYAATIANLRSAGESTTEWEKKWYENRLQQQQLFFKQSENISKAMNYALNPAEEGTVAADDALVENLLLRRNRVRQFMGMESGKKEGLESEFAVFELNDFAGQLEQLESWYQQGIFSHEEYERRKTDITREQTRARLEMSQQVLGAVNDLLGAQASVYAAQKDEELRKAGDNERRKYMIQKQYAEKEKKLSVAQAMISGALSIMRIWESKTGLPEPAASILKGILTAAMVATTATQVKAIKAQQFAKGLYPVRGADDGRMYNAEYVGVPKTGIYKKPSLGLFAEKPEMVIDYPTLRNIQFNNPALIDAIMAHRRGGTDYKPAPAASTQQYADGKWPAGATTVSNEQVLEKIEQLVSRVENLKIYASIETIERERNKYLKIQQTKGL